MHKSTNILKSNNELHYFYLKHIELMSGTGIWKVPNYGLVFSSLSSNWLRRGNKRTLKEVMLHNSHLTMNITFFYELTNFYFS
jgi:hypothetical protein